MTLQDVGSLKEADRMDDFQIKAPPYYILRFQDQEIW